MAVVSLQDAVDNVVRFRERLPQFETVGYPDVSELRIELLDMEPDEKTIAFVERRLLELEDKHLFGF